MILKGGTIMNKIPNNPVRQARKVSMTANLIRTAVVALTAGRGHRERHEDGSMGNGTYRGKAV